MNGLYVTPSMKIRRRLAKILIFFCAMSLLTVVRAQESIPQESKVLNTTTSAKVTRKKVKHPRENTYMKRKWGVEISFVRHAAAGYMLEFRYKVLDPKKAAPIFNRQTKPILTHVKSGASLIVPTPAKTGALRNSNPPLINRTYWLYFANPGKLVKSGDLVNIEIGDFRIENIAVQ